MRPLSRHPGRLPFCLEHHNTHSAPTSVQINCTSQSSRASKSILVSESLFFGFWSGRQSYELPSKSLDAWYKNIDYRSLGGPYRFTVFYLNQHSIMQNAAELTSWIQISKQPGMDQGGARCLCVCNHVGELPKHIPRLFPKQGHLLQSQLQTRMTVTNIRSIILWKRKRILLWSNESIPHPESLFQHKVWLGYRWRGNERTNETKREKWNRWNSELDSLQNSIAFSLKRKVKEKRMVRKKGNKGRRTSN